MSELKYIYKKKLRLSTQKCSAAYYEAKSEEVSEGFPFPSALSERKYNSRALLLFLSGGGEDNNIVRNNPPLGCSPGLLTSFYFFIFFIFFPFIQIDIWWFQHIFIFTHLNFPK